MPRAYLKLHSWSRVKKEMSGRNAGQRGRGSAGVGRVLALTLSTQGALRAGLGSDLTGWLWLLC